jgi:Gpi18-like mannosyltransferase
MPFYQYILWLFGFIAGSEEHIANCIGYLRAVTLLFDFAGLWLLWKWADKAIDFNLLLLLCIITVASFYNTIIWGQVDSIEAFFVFAAMYFGYRKQLVISVIALVLAVNMKLQAGIFLPVWALVVLPGVFGKGSRRNLLVIPLVAVISQGLIVLPFLFGSKGIRAIGDVIAGSMHNMEQLSANAYNFWYWTTKDYPGAVPDNTAWLWGLTAKQLGLIAFFTLAFFALLPLLKKSVADLRAQACHQIDKETIWLTSALICLLFFYCNTEMHERYAHPAFLFITAYTIKHRTYWLFVLFSLAYVLNLEGALRWLSLPNYDTVIFNGRFVSSLYAIVVASLFYYLYKPSTRIDSQVPALSEAAI